MRYYFQSTFCAYSREIEEFKSENHSYVTTRSHIWLLTNEYSVITLKLAHATQTVRNSLFCGK